MKYAGYFAIPAVLTWLLAELDPQIDSGMAATLGFGAGVFGLMAIPFSLAVLKQTKN